MKHRRILSLAFILVTIILNDAILHSILEAKSKRRAASSDGSPGTRLNSEASQATGNMVASLSSKANADDKEVQKYLQENIGSLQSKDANIALNIHKTSVESIKTIFKQYQFSDENSAELLRTIKQTACIFVAETHYGTYERGDQCDQTNIGQIRPPAYKEIVKNCDYEFRIEELAFLGSGTNCGNLHPYELPICCSALSEDQKRHGTCERRESPVSCVTPEKKDYLQKQEIISSTANWVQPQAQGPSPVVEPIACKSTSGKTYYRIPAIPEHSIFSSIYYLKIIGYYPMSDEAFQSFGANRYNAADPGQRRDYQSKLSTCLKMLNEPENEKIIADSLRKIQAIKTTSRETQLKTRRVSTPPIGGRTTSSVGKAQVNQNKNSVSPRAPGTGGRPAPAQRPAPMSSPKVPPASSEEIEGLF
jgi:hypothetical protein